MELENQSLRMGLRDGLPIGIGYLSVSFAFGLFAAGAGLAVWQSVLLSLFNLTSAGQLAAVPIIVALGSLVELGLTQLVINSRYALMSVALSQKLGPSVRRRDRFLIAFATADEIFAVACSKETLLGRRYFYGILTAPYVGWTLGTLLGALAGSILPPVVVSALGISIYAMFIASVAPELGKRKRTALCVVVAAAFSCLFRYVSPLDRIPDGFIIIIIAVAVSLAFAALFPLQDEEVDDE